MHDDIGGFIRLAEETREYFQKVFATGANDRVMLQEAVEEVSRILDDMKRAQRPNNSKIREYMKNVQDVTKYFVNACQHGIKAIDFADAGRFARAVGERSLFDMDMDTVERKMREANQIQRELTGG